MDKSFAAFHYLKAKFPKVSEAKIKEGIFIGSQIRSVLRDTDFEALLNPIKKTAWQAFRNICCNFLGNHKSENYPIILADLVKSYQQWDATCL